VPSFSPRGGLLALLIAYPLVLAAGQILFKRTALGVSGLPPLRWLTAMLSTPEFYAACVLYGAATVLWVWVLTRLSLAAAYPFVALSFVVVPLAGWWLFGEAPTLRGWVGIALIVAGVVIANAPAAGERTGPPGAEASPAPRHTDSRSGPGSAYSAGN